MLKHNLVKILISLIAVIFLIKTINWPDVLNVFSREFSKRILVEFLAVASVIALIYGCRWRLLLNRKITHRASIVSALISLGGNMFLPVRGGDLLRVQYTQEATGMRHASLLSRLIVEKFLDMASILVVGIIAIMAIHRQSFFNGYPLVAMSTLLALAAIFGVTLLIKYLNQILLRWLHPAFCLAGKDIFFQQHLVHLVDDAGQPLTVRNTMPPFIITLAMWLSAYSLSYILAASFVGINISYSESLLIMSAGVLGLMLPAAPSGIGTYHASVVSAFVFLDRSPTEGLLVATAIHLLFFVVFALPAALLCGSWRFGKTVPG